MGEIILIHKIKVDFLEESGRAGGGGVDEAVLGCGVGRCPGEQLIHHNTMSDDEERESCSQIAIIREVYDSDSAHETFELELERALEKGVATIVIEPTTLGDETARWIAVGNCLHKTAVLAGFGAITSGLIWHDTAYVCVPLGTLSLFCTGVYAASWQFDPCCKYQVEYDSGRLSRLPLQSLSSASPVVLVRRDDSRRKILHSCVSLVSFSYCMWRLYQLYK